MVTKKNQTEKKTSLLIIRDGWPNNKYINKINTKKDPIWIELFGRHCKIQINAKQCIDYNTISLMCQRENNFENYIHKNKQLKMDALI